MRRAALLVAASLLALATVAAAPAQGAKRGVVKHSAGDAQTTLEYWTAKRMRRAEPRGIALPGGFEPATGVARPGAPIYVPGVRPHEAATPEARKGTVPAGARVGAQSHIDFKRYEVRKTRKFPARTHGKVFATDRLGAYACSATVVTSENKSTVFTAGHCVRDFGWAKRFLFVPGFRNGSKPFGKFPARDLFTTRQWAGSKNRKFDIGAAVVRRNRAGNEVQRAVGARGIAFNQRRQQRYKELAYPAAPPFNGQLLFACESPYGGADLFAAPGPPPLRIGCDLTAGASGGGWVIRNEFVSSVDSYEYIGETEHIYGPYFGKAARNLWKRASR